MNTTLHETLAARADRAEPVDLADVLVDVRERAERNSRRRRNLVAAGGGVAAVAAVAGTVLALAPSSATHRDGNAGAPPAHSVPASASSIDAARASAERQAAALAAERSAAERAAAAQKSAASAGASAGLDPVAPAPKRGEVSIALVPKGWVLLGTETVYTTYGPPSLRNSDASIFEGKLVVTVSMRYPPDGPFDLTVAGHPASYATDSGDQFVHIAWTSKIGIDFQVPAAARITKAELLKLAGTLDVRSVKEYAVG